MPYPGHSAMPGNAPQPGVVPLRPLGLAEILGGAIGYIRANPLVTLGISAGVIAIVQVVQVVGQLTLLRGVDRTASPQSLIGYGLGSLGFSLVLLLVTLGGFAVLSAMLLVVLSRAVLGRPTSLGEAWATAKRRVPGLIGASLLAGLIVTVILMIGILPIVLVGVGTGAGAATGVTATILVPLMIAAVVYVAVSLSLVAPTYVLEDIGVVAALTRSRALVRGTWWRTFGIVLVAGLISLAITLAIGIPFGLIGGVSALSGSGFGGAGFGGPGSVVVPTASALIIGAVSSIIAGTITAPFSGGVYGLIYLDQRIRRERFDVDLAQAAAGGTPGT